MSMTIEKCANCNIELYAAYYWQEGKSYCLICADSVPDTLRLGRDKARLAIAATPEPPAPDAGERQEWEVRRTLRIGGIPCSDVAIKGKDLFDDGFICNADPQVAEQIVSDHHLAGMVPRLVEALRTSADWFHDTHRNVFGPDVENCDHGQCAASLATLNAVSQGRVRE